MVIGLNGQRLLDRDPAGPEKYTYNLYKEVARQDKKNTYVLYLDKTPPPRFFEDLSPGSQNFRYRIVPKIISWTQVSLPICMTLDKVDAFFTPVHTLPIILIPFVKTICTLHGLEYTTNQNAGIIPPGIHEWFIAAFSTKLIAPSEAVRDAVLDKKWPLVNPRKITVVPEGVDSSFHKRDRQEIDEVRSKYNLGQDPYLITISTIQPRKNLPRLIEGFGKTGLNNLKLVIAGKIGWKAEESINAPKKFGVADRVIFVGHVPEDDLPKLISGAVAFISCSIDEGFGLPLLETMACGVPTIVSNIPSYVELAGSLSAYVDPYDTNSIRDAILQTLKNQPTNTNASIDRASTYTWEKTASKVLSIIQGAVKDF